MVAEPAVLFPDLEGHWFPVKDGDPRVAAMYTRHYSYRPYKDNRRRLRRQQNFAGMGETIVLLTATADAAWVWRRCAPTPEMVEKYRWQTGVVCAFFRNEGPVRSSDLIREACEIAWQRWPGERLYTFVWDEKVGTGQQKGRNAIGWCYRKAGWRVCGRNADGRLTILEILPTDSRRHGDGQRESNTRGGHSDVTAPSKPGQFVGRGAGARDAHTQPSNFELSEVNGWPSEAGLGQDRCSEPDTSNATDMTERPAGSTAGAPERAKE